MIFSTSLLSILRCNSFVTLNTNSFTALGGLLLGSSLDYFLFAKFVLSSLVWRALSLTEKRKTKLQSVVVFCWFCTNLIPSAPRNGSIPSFLTCLLPNRGLKSLFSCGQQPCGQASIPPVFRFSWHSCSHQPAPGVTPATQEAPMCPFTHKAPFSTLFVISLGTHLSFNLLCTTYYRAHPRQIHSGLL